MPPLDVPADPMVGAPTGRVFIVEPIENPVPKSDLGGGQVEVDAQRTSAAAEMGDERPHCLAPGGGRGRPR
jgi:hypothetical protein